jgi:hypothetical protein
MEVFTFRSIWVDGIVRNKVINIEEMSMADSDKFQ